MGRQHIVEQRGTGAASKQPPCQAADLGVRRSPLPAERSHHPAVLGVHHRSGSLACERGDASLLHHVWAVRQDQEDHPEQQRATRREATQLLRVAPAVSSDRQVHHLLLRAGGALLHHGVRRLRDALQSDSVRLLPRSEA